MDLGFRRDWEKMSREDLQMKVVRHSALSDWYALLCYLLQMPSRATVAQLGEVSPADDVRSIVYELGNAVDDLGAITEGLEKVHASVASGECSLSDLRREYTRLFAHPKHPCVQPYESLFLDGERVASGKPSAQPCLFVNPVAMDAIERYKKERLPVASHEFPADHVTIELEFASKCHHQIAWLANALLSGGDGHAGIAYREELSGRLERLQTFKQVHILNWMPHFFDALSCGGCGCFYPAVGALGSALMRAERDGKLILAG